MIQRREGFFRGFNDFELFYQIWSTGKARATLVVTHGLGEHSEPYHRLATGVVSDDFEIYAWDLRGHGRSEGKRGVIGSFVDYCEDLKAFVSFVKKENGGKPVFLIGHSMGGLITTTTVIRFGALEAKAMVLSSPLFDIAVQVPYIKERVGKFMANILPDLTLHNELKFEDLSHDPASVDEYNKDILRHDRISSKLFVQMVETMNFCMKSADQIRLPLLLQQAGEDRIVSRKASEKFFELVGSQDKEIKIYEDYYHEIYNEVGRELVFSDLKEWLKKHF